MLRNINLQKAVAEEVTLQSMRENISNQRSVRSHCLIVAFVTMKMISAD